MKVRNATPGTQVTEKASNRHGVILPLGTAVVGTGPENMVRVRFEDSDMDLLVHPRNLRRRRGGGSAFPDTISVRRGGIRYPMPVMTSAKAINRGDTVIAHAGPLSEDEHGLRFQIRPATIGRAEIYDASGPHTIKTPAPDPGGYLRAGVGEDHDPDLIERLRDLGDRFGPAGVAIVAAGLSDPNYVIARLLRTPYQAPTRPAEPAPDVVETAKQSGGVLLDAARALGDLDNAASAYWDAVAAYTTERGVGPLSTSLGWVIRHGEISKALAAYESCTPPRPHQSRL